MNKQYKILLATLVTVILVFVAGILIYRSNETSTANVQSEPTKTNLIRDFNNRKGPSEAKVKIVEFFDPECEGCKAFEPILKEILEMYAGKIQLITRYRLYHKSSYMAATANEAAAKQSKYWEYHELLFKKQGEWGHKDVPDKMYFIEYAKTLGLDVSNFEKDMDSQETKDNIANDIADGNSLNVRGTPTFYINGEELTELNRDSLISKIEDHLK